MANLFRCGSNQNSNLGYKEIGVINSAWDVSSVSYLISKDNFISMGNAENPLEGDYICLERVGNTVNIYALKKGTYKYSYSEQSSPSEVQIIEKTDDTKQLIYTRTTTALRQSTTVIIQAV